MEGANSKRHIKTDESNREQRSIRDIVWQLKEVELPIFKIDLLVLSNFEVSHENENRRIAYDRNNNKVILKTATFSDLQELQLAMLECIDNIIYDSKKLPEARYELVSRGSCLKSLQSKCAESENIKVSYQCDAKKKAIRCYAMTEREARLGVQLIEDEITQLKIHINASQLQLLQSVDWIAMIESLHTDFTSVYVAEDKDHIVIDSLKEKEATSCYNVINQYLAANTKLTKMSIVLENSRARCFQSRFQDSLRNKIRGSGDTLDIEVVSEDPLQIKVSLSGMKTGESITDELTSIDNQICQESISIDRTLFKDDVELVLKGLTKPCGKDFVYSFEKTHNCFIDVNIIERPEPVSAWDNVRDADVDLIDDVDDKTGTIVKTFKSHKYSRKSGYVHRKGKKKREIKLNYYQGSMNEYEAIQMSLLLSSQSVNAGDDSDCFSENVYDIKTEDLEKSYISAETSSELAKDINFKYLNDNRKLIHTECENVNQDMNVINEEHLGPQSQMDETTVFIKSDESEVERKAITMYINCTKIHLVLGQLVKQNADVLVNILSSDEDRFGGTIPSSFLEAGGQLLLKMYEDINSSSSGFVIVTSSIGQLVNNCSAVFHVKVMKSFQMKKMMNRLISDILTECRNWNYQTVALPPLCTDTTSSEVAVSMLTEIKQCLKSGNGELKDIFLIVNDDRTFSVFEDAIKTISYTPACGTKVKSRHCQSKQNEMRMIKRPEHNFDDKFQENTKEIQSCSTVTVTAENKTKCTLAKELLESRIKEEFLHEEIIEKKQGLQAITKEKITTIAALNDIKCIEGEKYFLLRGHEGTVRKICTDIMKVMLEERRTCTAWNVKDDIKRDTHKFVLSMLDCEPETPKYWKNYKQGCRLSSLVVSAKHFVTKNKFEFEELRKNSHAFSTIVGMINATFDHKLLGLGKDAEGLEDFTYRKLFVQKIERIENLDLYEQFFRKRQRLYRRLYKAGEIAFPKLEEQRKCSGSVLTASHIHPALDQDVHSGINEYLLFHGTKSENVSTICNDGLEPRISNDGSMYGRGIYAAEYATKADQYADDKKRRSAGRGQTKTMFLIRMVLGNCLVLSQKNPQKYRKPPCTTCLQDDCRDTGHGDKFGRFYDSILGDNRKLFREFIVYESCLCYPEYLITYERR